MGNNESSTVQNGSSSINRSPAPVSLTAHNGHPRKIEDDYIDVGNDLETCSKEEMEDQFIKIVVSYIENYTRFSEVESAASKIKTC